ncbi:ABC transporter substrate-binding protein [Actinomadura keratinilytica]|jgi:NitT/TauT family transport system substrate-binding protein|uniref:MetQ/NlpA family ABC transporter substrate-binding protein n=1 Tax=Actinomadura keratinilytica TaxID=547461 RepID=A0ABP7ZCE2_9ACTN
MIRVRAALAAAAVLLLSSCGGGSPSDDAASGGLAEVKVSVIPIVDVAPVYVGIEQGFFKEQNLKLEVVTAQGGAAIVPAVVAGQVDIGFSNFVSLLVAKSKGLPLKVVSSGVGSTGVTGKDFGGIVVKADSPIKSAKDLAGKKVAVNTLNNINDTTVRASVRKAGGDPTGVKFTELAFPDMGAALDKGNVDAVQVVEPFLSTALKSGGRLVASNYVDTADKLPIAGYFTSEKTAATRSDVVKRFTAALQKSLRYSAAHPEAVRTTLPTYTKIDNSVLQQLTLPDYPAQVNRDGLQSLADLAARDGLLAKAPDVSALLP